MYKRQQQAYGIIAHHQDILILGCINRQQRGTFLYHRSILQQHNALIAYLAGSGIMLFRSCLLYTSAPTSTLVSTTVQGHPAGFGKLGGKLRRNQVSRMQAVEMGNVAVVYIHFLIIFQPFLQVSFLTDLHGWESLQAVSYTHLDVYKRQLQRFLQEHLD